MEKPPLGLVIIETTSWLSCLTVGIFRIPCPNIRLIKRGPWMRRCKIAALSLNKGYGSGVGWVVVRGVLFYHFTPSSPFGLFLWRCFQIQIRGNRPLQHQFDAFGRHTEGKRSEPRPSVLFIPSIYSNGYSDKFNGFSLCKTKNKHAENHNQSVLRERL